MNWQTHWQQCLVTQEPVAPPGLTTWNGSDAAQRFGVYRNNVAHSLVDALADGFPVVQALVGTEFFRAMARDYALADPPRTPVLAHWGDGFAAFIAGFAPASSLAYLADMARLEHAVLRATHAADAHPLTPSAWRTALLTPERLPGLRLTLHPSVWTQVSPHAIASLWLAHQEGADLDLGQVDPAQGECVLLWRRGWEVQVQAVERAVQAFVAALAQGLPFGQAAAHAQAVDHRFDVAASLATLLSHDMLCQPSPDLSPETL